MKVNWYSLASGKLQKKQAPSSWLAGEMKQTGESWLEVDETEPQALRQFLAPLDIHPLQLARCLDSVIDPGVLSFADSVLMEYPASLDRESAEHAYLTILLQSPVLVTIRHGPMPALDDLLRSLTAEDAPPLNHLPQIIYLILDHFADLNVDAQIEIRDQSLHLAKIMEENPRAIGATDLARLRWQVENIISLIENQLYCVSRLAASDIRALQIPDRKAYIQDLVSEAEIAQRGAYRLETRVNDLYRDYQMAGADRLEKRLRLLTIVSAISLPLGLVAGLLGMNVGGMPGTNEQSAFLAVIALMTVIALALYWYFRRNGWFD